MQSIAIIGLVLLVLMLVVGGLSDLQYRGQTNSGVREKIPPKDDGMGPGQNGMGGGGSGGTG